MDISSLATRVPHQVITKLAEEGISELRPAQEKAISAGLLDSENLLICTPTASGKTLIAELAATKTILNHYAKVIYIVPLVALASEKAKEFRRKWSGLFRIALSVGDFDSADPYLAEYDLIICTAEKLDSLLRHHAHWLRQVSLLVIDEIHLLNDVSRGPTLEIIITLLRQLIPEVQLIGLSATIGNPRELADWLNAKLVEDNWRPIPLHQGVYFDGEIQFK
ncbi:MAG: DEAD/DEAH box helicase [Candidatus Aenigmarchaeota archaeon]|nr:DEAD/DEAH box helicase [Candidatus Aenigmarchaeota archaeon]